MFCPKCGSPEQLPETYCRRCGVFLPDLDKKAKPRNTPQEHVKVNLVLSSMTIVASLTLAILLYSILGFRETTHPLIYVTAGLLIAMGCWHVQSLYRTLQLRKHFRANRPEVGLVEPPGSIEAAPTGKFLDAAELGNVVPATVTEQTTLHLVERKDGLSQTE